MSNHTQSKATPGPWRVDETWNLITADCGMIEVAACHTGERMAPKRNSHKTATANARLIAAAPDLLNALQRIQNNASARKWNSESTDRADLEAWQEIEATAKAAIAKAEGSP